jgi:hypothetical protein
MKCDIYTDAEPVALPMSKFDLQRRRDEAMHAHVVGLAQDQLAALRAKMQPCRSPYCECMVGQCTSPGFYDAREFTINTATGAQLDAWANAPRSIGVADAEMHALLQTNFSQIETRVTAAQVARDLNSLPDWFTNTARYNK